MFSNIVEQQEWKEYRNKQINHAVFVELIKDWNEVESLPKEIREFLDKNVKLSSLEVVKEEISSRKDTIKTLFRLDDGNLIESVLMMHEGRNTVCVSCQSGCPVGCTFCATGQLGLKRNLTAREIVDQVLYFARKLKNNGTSRDMSLRNKISNIVFMGMGEPMLNLENVSQSIEWLTDADKLAMGKRRITVSTCGYTRQLTEFLDRFAHIGLAISLHAPNQELREKIMPNVAKSNHINDLLDVCKDYSQKTKRRVSYEYILIEGVNDELTHASELAYILRDHQYFVNLIPYNEVASIDYKRPNSMRVNRFKEELKKLNVPVAVRVTMGEDIGGACGQLAGKK